MKTNLHLAKFCVFGEKRSVTFLQKNFSIIIVTELNHKKNAKIYQYTVKHMTLDTILRETFRATKRKAETKI